MSERIKGKVIHVGTFDEDGNPEFWVFDGLKKAVALELGTEGGPYWCGYSLDELHQIHDAELDNI